MIAPIYSVKTKIGISLIHGNGLFATAPFVKGEIVFVKNGHILTNSERCSDNTLDYDWPLNDTYTLGAREQSESDIVRLCINHSCDPNCGLRGINAGLAMRDIMPGEELTFDYAMLDNEDYRFECRCGNKNCRSVITGFDWKQIVIQERYRGYFSNHIQERISELPLKQIDSE